MHPLLRGRWILTAVERHINTVREGLALGFAECYGGVISLPFYMTGFIPFQFALFVA